MGQGTRRRCTSSSWRKVRGGVRGRTAPGRQQHLRVVGGTVSHSRLPSTTRRFLTAWTFQTPDGSFLRNQNGGTSALNIEIHSPPFGLVNEEGALGWSPSTRAGLLGTGAMLPCPHAPMAGSPRRQRPRARRGAEFGRSTSVGPPSRASPSSWGRSRACTDLAGRARVPAGGETEVPFDALRIFSKVPKQRGYWYCTWHTLRHGVRYLTPHASAASSPPWGARCQSCECALRTL